MGEQARTARLALCLTELPAQFVTFIIFNGRDEIRTRDIRLSRSSRHLHNPIGDYVYNADVLLGEQSMTDSYTDALPTELPAQSSNIIFINSSNSSRVAY